MSEVMTSIECVNCGKARDPDRRRSCAHCGYSPRTGKVAAPKTAGAAAPGEDRVEGEDLVVVASDPAELVTAQKHMIARLDEKIADAEKELAEAKSAPARLPGDEHPGSATAQGLLAQARARLEESSKRLATTAERRVVFLQKVRAALAAGYVMVPNFPGHVIAIRTARKRPARRYIWNVSQSSQVEPAGPDAALAPGEGKYVAPIPEHTSSPSGDEKRQDIELSGWDEEIGLPVEFIKPAVVERTAKALDLRIFDEVVLIRDGGWSDTFAGKDRPPGGRDPMVVGRVILRSPNHRYRSQRRVLSFLIAWFMDTKLI